MSMQRSFLSAFCGIVLSLSIISNSAQANIFEDLSAANEFFHREVWGIVLHGKNDKHYYGYRPQVITLEDDGPLGEPGEEQPPQKRLFKRKEEVRLADVAGHDGVVAKIRSIIDQFKNPERLRSFGGKPKSGLILEGPSGTGKTLIARAIANELGYTFHDVSGSSMVEIYVGKGAQHVRQLFEKARQTAPSMIFIDEIDALAVNRESDGNVSGGDNEYRQTLNEFLCQMNNIKESDKILVACATNTIKSVDPAFKAPHRFEIISIPLPDKQGREDILRLYLNRLPKLEVTPDVISSIVEKTKGFSGAQIESLVSNAVQIAVAEPLAEKVTGEHLIAALQEARENMKTGIFGSKNQTLDTVTFDDIAGMQPVIDEFRDLVESIKNPELLKKYGVTLPKGILLAGPPGVGKTMLAQALANEAGCTFLYVSGSSIDGKFVGDGAKKIRELFGQARIVHPTIIFFDELDAISRRNGGPQTINELLTQMDGFEKENDIVVLAATNMPEEVDYRLKRAGRFSRIITFKEPGKKARRSILELYLKKLPNSDKKSIEEVIDDLVLHTKGLTGAALKDLVNEAASLAFREKADKVGGTHLRQALDRALKTKKSRQ